MNKHGKMFACVACQDMKALTKSTCTNMEGIQGLVGVQDRGALRVHLHSSPVFYFISYKIENASPFKGR